MFENFDFNQVVRIIVGLVALYFMIKWIRQNGMKAFFFTKTKSTKEEMAAEIRKALKEQEEQLAAAEAADREAEAQRNAENSEKKA